MSLTPRPFALGSLIVFTAAWLAPFESALIGLGKCLAQDAVQQDGFIQDQERQEGLGQPPDEEDMPRRSTRKSRQKSARSARGRVTKETAGRSAKTAKRGAGAGTEAATKKGALAEAAAITFSRDVAPILVANCMGCHSSGQRGLTRGKLDLTSFAKLMAGTPGHKVIVPGKPDESHLVLRIRGEETPRMPQGANVYLSEGAIAKVEQWIKGGAKLDAGLDPQKGLETYAATPEQLRRFQLAKMSPKERDEKVEAAGRQRWKRANPKLAPEIAPSEHFMLFSNLPKDRSTATLRGMETQFGHLKRLLGSAATDWGEKVGLYVFNERKDFVEFTRAVENREVDTDLQSSFNMAPPQPYVVVLDPLAGKKETPAVSRRRPRGKRGEERESSGPERSLNGLLAEALAEGTVLSQGKTPRWLAIGVGEFFGEQLEPHSPYYQRLHLTAFEKYKQGWPTKANEALGDGSQVTVEEVRAIGLAVVECLMMPEYRPLFPTFLQGMSEGKEKLDDVLLKTYKATREDFFNITGEIVAERYGQSQ